MTQCVDIPKVQMSLSWTEKLKALEVGGDIDISKFNSRSVSRAMHRIHSSEDNDMLFTIRPDTTGIKRVWRLQ